MGDIIDRINLGAMNSVEAVAWYTGNACLVEHERVVLGQVATEVRDQPILDIGVGGGRTVPGLRELSQDYLGIDYSQAMVDTCRKRFPDVHFEHMDAREMNSVASSSIALAMFSCNGISMVGHDDRLAILREVHRVLKPRGIFLFTTYNRNSDDATTGFRLPEFELSRNPVQCIRRAARWTADTVTSINRRRKFVKHEVRTPEYALINDHCHNFGVMLYYITLADQRRQLEEAGFESDAPAFERTGQRITDDSRSNSMLILARKR